MKRKLVVLLEALLLLGFASASQAQLSGSAGYVSSWFSPGLREIDPIRLDVVDLGVSYTSSVTEKNLLRAQSQLGVGNTGRFNVQWGWQLNQDTRFFIGPSILYLDEGAIPGLTGSTFALGVAGSLDLEAALSENREPLPVRFVFGVARTTRDLELIDTSIANETNGVIVTLGMVAAPTFLNKTAP